MSISKHAIFTLLLYYCTCSARLASVCQLVTSTFHKRQSLLNLVQSSSHQRSAPPWKQRFLLTDIHDHAPTNPSNSSDPSLGRHPSSSSTCSPVSFQPVLCAGSDTLKFACTCQIIVKGDQDSFYTWCVPSRHPCNGPPRAT